MEKKPTKQDLFMEKLKSLGGSADTNQMAEAMDEDMNNIHSLSKHLERRRLIEIVHAKKDLRDYHAHNLFKIIKNRKQKYNGNENN